MMILHFNSAYNNVTFNEKLTIKNMRTEFPFPLLRGLFVKGDVFIGEWKYLVQRFS